MKERDASKKNRIGRKRPHLRERDVDFPPMKDRYETATPEQIEQFNKKTNES